MNPWHAFPVHEPMRQALAAVAAGSTLTAAAEAHGVSVSALHRRAVRAGVGKRGRGPAPMPVPADVLDLARSGELTQAEAAARAGVSVRTLRRRMEQA